MVNMLMFIIVRNYTEMWSFQGKAVLMHKAINTLDNQIIKEGVSSDRKPF